MKIRPARQSRPRGLFLLSTYVPASRSRRAYEAAHLGSQGHFFGVAVCCFRRGINERPTTLFRQRFAPTKGRIQNTPKVKSLGWSAVAPAPFRDRSRYRRASGSRNKKRTVPRPAGFASVVPAGTRRWAGTPPGLRRGAARATGVSPRLLAGLGARGLSVGFGRGTKRAPGSRRARERRRRAPRVEPTPRRRARRRPARGCRGRAWRRSRGAGP